ncbi:MAG: glycosyltransferase family 2 protein [Nitrospirota bacterium]
MPAYNAAKTLNMTYVQIPEGVADEIILVDDASKDETTQVANKLKLKVITHPHNVGYGGNQKTCYMEALRDKADIVIMLHPDGQYDPKVLPQLIEPIKQGKADMVLGSRMLIKGEALKGRMPLYKFLANKFLTTIENLSFGTKFSECHTGYRAYSRKFLETVPFLRNSNDFVFDTEIIAQAVHFKFKVAEIPVNTKYFKDASSVNFKVSVIYGINTLMTLLKYIFHNIGFIKCKLFTP